MRTASLGNVHCVFVGLECYVPACLGVEIDEMHRLYLVLAFVTRYDDIVKGYVSFVALGADMCLIVYLGIIGLEICGELGFWGADELHVAAAGNDKAVC